jgi:hypothetical protein
LGGKEVTVKLYKGIYITLTNDSVLLDLLNIDTNVIPNSEYKLLLADKFQKRRKPQNIVDNLPIISFYSPSSGSDRRNSEVWDALFAFDIYTSDDVERAHLIGERIVELFDDQIVPIEGITTFTSTLEEQYESMTDMPNTYCWTVIITMSVSGLDC